MGWVVWYGMVWYGMVWCGVVWCGVVWYGVVWCGMVWYGVVWCGMVWCGVVWCGIWKSSEGPSPQITKTLTRPATSVCQASHTQASLSPAEPCTACDWSGGDARAPPADGSAAITAQGISMTPTRETRRGVPRIAAPDNAPLRRNTTTDTPGPQRPQDRPAPAPAPHGRMETVTDIRGPVAAASARALPPALTTAPPPPPPLCPTAVRCQAPALCAGRVRVPCLGIDPVFLVPSALLFPSFLLHDPQGCPHGGVCAPRAHRVGYLNNFSGKCSAFETLVKTVPWRRLPGEELWQGVRAPLGERTCDQRGNGRKEDESQAC